MSTAAIEFNFIIEKINYLSLQAIIRDEGYKMRTDFFQYSFWQVQNSQSQNIEHSKFIFKSSCVILFPYYINTNIHTLPSISGLTNSMYMHTQNSILYTSIQVSTHILTNSQTLILLQFQKLYKSLLRPYSLPHPVILSPISGTATSAHTN